MCDYGKENILKDIKKYSIDTTILYYNYYLSSPRGVKNVKYKIDLF